MSWSSMRPTYAVRVDSCAVTPRRQGSLGATRCSVRVAARAALGGPGVATNREGAMTFRPPAALVTTALAALVSALLLGLPSSPAGADGVDTVDEITAGYG